MARTFTGRLGNFKSRLANVILAYSETEKSYIASGGLNASGASVSQVRLSYESSGGLVLSGSANQSESNRQVANGGVVLAGTADTNLIINFSGSGLVVLSGQAERIVNPVLREAEGGVTISGSALYRLEIRECAVTLTGVDGPGPVEPLGIPVEDDDLRIFIDCFSKSSVGGTADKQFVECIEMRYVNSGFLPARTLCNQGLFVLEDPVGRQIRLLEAKEGEVSLLSFFGSKRYYNSSKSLEEKEVPETSSVEEFITGHETFKDIKYSKNRSQKRNNLLDSNLVEKQEIDFESIVEKSLQILGVNYSYIGISKIKDEFNKDKILVEAVISDEEPVSKTIVNNKKRTPRINSLLENNKVDNFVENEAYESRNNLAILADQVKKKQEASQNIIKSESVKVQPVSQVREKPIKKSIRRRSSATRRHPKLHANKKEIEKLQEMRENALK